ncbi:uncharacterized protein METZ01_LOCUS2738 [marine metagenome]|uniref:Uncharacterized protein n=1 Tax=marine metagenome TaxID=408172 RepID=A0A381N733_9ZZZZ
MKFQGSLTAVAVFSFLMLSCLLVGESRADAWASAGGTGLRSGATYDDASGFSQTAGVALENRIAAAAFEVSQSPEEDRDSCDCEPRSPWNTVFLAGLGLLLLALIAWRSKNDGDETDDSSSEGDSL